MNIPYFALRLMTVACYFMPFVFFLSTCKEHAAIKPSFNKNAALAAEDSKLKHRLAEFDSLSRSVISSDPKTSDNFVKEARVRADFVGDHSKNLQVPFVERTIMPTDYSLSGLGVIYLHDNLPARISMLLSLLTSIFVLLMYAWANRKHLIMGLLIFNLVTLGGFFIASVGFGVTVLPGFWVLVFLLLVQIATDYLDAGVNPNTGV